MGWWREEKKNGWGTILSSTDKELLVCSVNVLQNKQRDELRYCLPLQGMLDGQVTLHVLVHIQWL